eukprot:5340231-Amphidinium_carterae.1
MTWVAPESSRAYDISGSLVVALALEPNAVSTLSPVESAVEFVTPKHVLAIISFMRGFKRMQKRVGAPSASLAGSALAEAAEAF